MHLVSYLHNGQRRCGVVSDGEIIDGADAAGFDSIRECLEASGLDLLRTRSEGVSTKGPSVGEVDLLPVIPDPSKIICVGVNYASHRDEGKRAPAPYPTIFTRFADSQIAHGAPAPIPPETAKFDYEGELALVIGTAGHRISEADAMGHVAGYACYNDFTARDWQKHGAQWTPGKNFPGTGAFGPWLVTTDEIDDIRDSRLETRVNGEIRQSALIDEMLFPIPTLISYISTFTPLAAGDVIVTGTPGGVGNYMDPPGLLSAGDVVEVEITGIGILRNTVQ